MENNTNTERGLLTMEFIKKIAMFTAGLLIFIIFFLIGASLTQTSPKLIVYATALNKWNYEVREQTTVFYNGGEEMARLGYKREYSNEFPDLLKDGVVAVEDRRFYQHIGMDSKGMARALWSNIKAGHKAEGGSTITQQLARTLFLVQDKTYSRKIKEVFYAVALEEKYSKNEILEMYLNEIYMGRGCSGLASASRVYFGKNIQELNKAEITILIAMIQAPEFYAPENNLEGLKKRQNTVINLLVEQDILDDIEAEAIKSQKLNFRSVTYEEDKHPYYINYLEYQLKEILDEGYIYSGGLKIYTTIDKRMQEAAELNVAKHARSLGWQGIGAQDIAVVSLEPGSGMIKAMVGGSDFKRNQINMVISPRQPGSTIKALYYAAAINEGLIKSDTIINNQSRDFNGYQPQNLSISPVKTDIRQALVSSYNVASVEVLNILGVERAVDYLKKMGIKSIEDDDYHLALALGGMKRGISPLQLATAYTIFPNAGGKEEPYTINYIENEQARVIYKQKSTYSRIISKRTAEEMDRILKAVVSYGTARNAQIPIQSGGKTGTTTEIRDLWYVGYISELLTVIWIGNSDGNPIEGYNLSAGRIAAPLWRDYMNTLYYARIFPEKPAVISVPDEESVEDNEEEIKENEDEEIGEEIKENDDEEKADDNNLEEPVQENNEINLDKPENNDS